MDHSHNNSGGVSRAFDDVIYSYSSTDHQLSNDGMSELVKKGDGLNNLMGVHQHSSATEVVGEEDSGKSVVDDEDDDKAKKVM